MWTKQKINFSSSNAFILFSERLHHVTNAKSRVTDVLLPKWIKQFKLFNFFLTKKTPCMVVPKLQYINNVLPAVDSSSNTLSLVMLFYYDQLDELTATLCSAGGHGGWLPSLNNSVSSRSGASRKTLFYEPSWPLSVSSFTINWGANL